MFWKAKRIKNVFFRFNIAYKVYVVIVVCVGICALVVGGANYNDNKKSQIQFIGSELEHIAQTAVLGLEEMGIGQGDLFDTAKITEMKKFLLQVKSKNNINIPIYMFSRKDDNKMRFILSTEPVEIKGVEYSLNDTMKKVYKIGTSSYSSIYKDKSGTWISAYAPIKNEYGFIFAIVEINREIGYYINQLRIRLLRVILMCLLGSAIGAFTGVLLLYPILRSIKNINKAAYEIQSGNYDHGIKIESLDEIGHLASTLEAMRISIKKHIDELSNAWFREKKAHLESVKTLSEAIAIREPYTKGHIQRVAKIAELIAEEMRLSNKEKQELKYGCILHDVGKIGINVDIINKTSQLTAEEYETIKKHPEFGAKIIEGVSFLGKAKEIVLHHQERYDGKGYPRGLKGEEIPVGARIVALIDAYDAMASDRPYRDGMPSNDIINIIKNESGKQFDPKVVEAFLKVKDRIPEIDKNS